MRKTTQRCAIFGVKGSRCEALRKKTHTHAEYARASKVELGSTFGCGRMRKNINRPYFFVYCGSRGGIFCIILLVIMNVNQGK